MSGPATVNRATASPPSAPDPLIGTELAGRYRILRLLGEGGMGRVYLGEHVRIGKLTAIKVLADDREVPQAADRFLQEAQATARIGHENIVDITDFGETPDGAVFFVMEYLDGEDLGVTLARSGPLPWVRARNLVVQICRALGAAHSKGIVHRDIKPENCFRVERSGSPDFVKVLDFGIAKLLGPRVRRLTRKNNLFGTPEYMAPEQARGAAVDHRIDIYAVGMILYELVTGQLPFTGDDYMGVLLRQVNDPVPPPSQLAPPGADFPPELDAVILKALAKNANERYQTTFEFAEALLWLPPTVADPGSPDAVGLDHSRPISVGHPTPPQTITAVAETRTGPSMTAWIAVGLLLLVGVLGGAVAFLAMGRADPPDAVAAKTPPPDDHPGGESAPAADADPTPPVVPAPDPANADGSAPAGAPEPTASGESPVAAPDPDAADPPAAAKPKRPKRRKDPGAGQLSSTQLRAGLRRVSPHLAGCVGRLIGGKEGDTVVVRMEIAGASGRVISAKATGAAAGTSLGACVANAARKAKFAPFRNPSMSVDHTFTL